MEGLPVHPWLPFLSHFWRPKFTSTRGSTPTLPGATSRGVRQGPYADAPSLFLRWGDTAPPFRGCVKTRSSVFGSIPLRHGNCKVCAARDGRVAVSSVLAAMG